MTAPTSRVAQFASRFETVAMMVRHFTRRRRLFMLPLLLLILVSAILLVAAGGLSYVAPFVYAIF